MSMSKFVRFPFVLVLLIVWALMRHNGISTSAGSYSGIALVFFTFVVFLIEFFKSADTSMTTFRIEMISSVFCTVLCTVLMTNLVRLNNIKIGDFVVACLVLFDACANPMASFGMALRDWQVDEKSVRKPKGR